MVGDLDEQALNTCQRCHENSPVDWSTGFVLPETLIK